MADETVLPEPTMADQNEQALAWLSGLPHGHELAWTTHHLSQVQPSTRGWVDVEVPELCMAIGWNWGFTIEEPELYAEAAAGADNLPVAVADPFTLPCPFDGLLELQLDETEERPARLRLIGQDGHTQWLDDAVAELQGEEMWRLHLHFAPEAADILGRTYPAISTLVELRDGAWWQTPVWTPAGISVALELWAATRANRPDLRFRYQPVIAGWNDDTETA